MNDKQSTELTEANATLRNQLSTIKKEYWDYRRSGINAKLWGLAVVMFAGLATHFYHRGWYAFEVASIFLTLYSVVFTIVRLVEFSIVEERRNSRENPLTPEPEDWHD